MADLQRPKKYAVSKDAKLERANSGLHVVNPPTTSRKFDMTGLYLEGSVESEGTKYIKAYGSAAAALERIKAQGKAMGAGWSDKFEAYQYGQQWYSADYYAWMARVAKFIKGVADKAK